MTYNSKALERAGSGRRAVTVFIEACKVSAKHAPTYVAPPKGKTPETNAKNWHHLRARESQAPKLYNLLRELRAIRTGTKMGLARALEAFASLPQAVRQALIREGEGINKPGMTLEQVYEVVYAAKAKKKAKTEAKTKKAIRPHAKLDDEELMNKQLHLRQVSKADGRGVAMDQHMAGNVIEMITQIAKMCAAPAITRFMQLASFAESVKLALVPCGDVFEIRNSSEEVLYVCKMTSEVNDWFKEHYGKRYPGLG